MLQRKGIRSDIILESGRWPGAGAARLLRPGEGEGIQETKTMQRQNPRWRPTTPASGALPSHRGRRGAGGRTDEVGAKRLELALLPRKTSRGGARWNSRNMGRVPGPQTSWSHLLQTSMGSSGPTRRRASSTSSVVAGQPALGEKRGAVTEKGISMLARLPSALHHRRPRLPLHQMLTHFSGQRKKQEKAF